MMDAAAAVEIKMALGNDTLLLNNATAVPVVVLAASRRRLELIEAYVCLTAITLSFLAVFGSIRRRYNNGMLRFLLKSGYNFSACSVSYTIGQMQSASFRNELFAIWAVFFLIVMGGSDSITAFSLDDNENISRYNLQLFFQSFWVGWLIGTYDHETRFRYLLYILWALSSFRTSERSQAMSSAGRSSGLVKNTKIIADFMDYEHELSNQDDVDPTCMKGYNYLVRGEDEEKSKVSPPHYKKRLDIADSEVITTHKIWQCKGKLLSSTGLDRDDRLKDMCLSFALFRLLSRRFAGYPLYESSHEKTWKFVRYGLISDKAGESERAFRVIEVELSFLYDFFYTKYPAIISRGMIAFRIIQSVAVIIGFWFAASALHHYQTPNGYLDLITISGRNVDVLVTGTMMVAILFVEIVQAFFLIFSDWSKVMWLCKYVQKSTWQSNRSIEGMIRFVCQEWVKPSKRWERKLAQYSLLETFDHNPFKTTYNYITTCHTGRPGINEGARIELPVEVKKAVTNSLRINGQQLTNGVASLERNGVEGQLSWACKQETTTHVIMVWHIATSLCEIELSEQANLHMETEDFVVATSLSKYCAYLVVFAPRFLPDHSYTTEVIFDQVLGEAKDVLAGCKSQASMYKKLMALCKGDAAERIIDKGAYLGQLLIEGIEHQELRWKILADLWAELMLFVAPSDDVDAHAEYLARGGEFVTHLWALLSHAGILKGDSPVQHV